MKLSLAVCAAFLILAAPALARDEGPAADFKSDPLGLNLQRAPKVHVQASSLKGKVNRLITAFNNLAASHNVLVANLNNCLRTVPVTQYDFYQYGNPTFFTTALDFTESGDLPDVQMAIRTC